MVRGSPLLPPGAAPDVPQGFAVGQRSEIANVGGQGSVGQGRTLKPPDTGAHAVSVIVQVLGFAPDHDVIDDIIDGSGTAESLSRIGARIGMAKVDEVVRVVPVAVM